MGLGSCWGGGPLPAISGFLLGSELYWRITDDAGGGAWLLAWLYIGPDTVVGMDDMGFTEGGGLP